MVMILYWTKGMTQVILSEGGQQEWILGNLWNMGRDIAALWIWRMAIGVAWQATAAANWTWDINPPWSGPPPFFIVRCWPILRGEQFTWMAASCHHNPAHRWSCLGLGQWHCGLSDGLNEGQVFQEHFLPCLVVCHSRSSKQIFGFGHYSNPPAVGKKAAALRNSREN